MTLIDTGNSLNCDGCIREVVAKDLNLKITGKHEFIETADKNQKMEILGYAHIEILIPIADKRIPFPITVAVIENLLNSLNLGMNFQRTFKGTQSIFFALLIFKLFMFYSYNQRLK